MPPQLKPMIGYIRVSMKREEMISPTIQRSAITDWARRLGRTITFWVEDLDDTGRNFKRKVQKAIEQVDGKTIGGIAVYRYDRWGRNAAESLANCKRVEMVGGVVESATEPLDPETAIGRYNRTNAFALAEMQSDIIGDNWKATHNHRRNAGLPATGRPRFGYIRLGRVPDPINPKLTTRNPAETEAYVPDWATEAPVIEADLYCQVVAGVSRSSLFHWLNYNGIGNAYGRPWSYQSVTDHLDTGFGAGFLRVHDPDCRCGNPGRCSTRIHIPGAHEPLIDLDLWNAYRRRRGLGEPTPQLAPAAGYSLTGAVGLIPSRTLGSPYSLTGLCRCGECSSLMTVSSQEGRPGYLYRCNQWRDYRTCPGVWPLRARMEAAVLDALREWSEDVEQHATITTARRRALAQSEDAAAQARKDIATAQKALARLLIQQAKDPDTPDEVYELARVELRADQAAAEEILERSVAEADQTVVADHGPVIAGLLAEWDFLPPARRRSLLATLIRHVSAHRVAPRKLEIVVTPVWEPCSEPCCTIPSGQKMPALLL